MSLRSIRKVVRPRSLLVFLGSLPAAGGLVGCTELADPAETCLLNTGCSDDIVVADEPLQPVVDSAWGCLDESAPRPLEFAEPTTQPVAALFVVNLVDPSNYMPIENVQFRLCSNGNIDCTDDLFGSAMAGDPPQRDPENRYTFRTLLPFRTADYFLRIEADGFVQFDYYFAEELNYNFDNRVDVPINAAGDTIEAELVYIGELLIPRVETYSSYFADFGGGIGENERGGVVLGRVYDCSGNPVTGAEIEAPNLEAPPPNEPGIIPFAYNKGVPTSGPRAVTGGDGVAGYANAFAGAVQVVATNSDGESYANATLRAAPRKITIADMRPRFAYARLPPPPQ